MDIKWVICHYKDDFSWIFEYTNDFFIHDRSEDRKYTKTLTKEKYVIEKNVGYNIFCYMDYIVNNYDNLPDVVLFGKDNMLERHITKEEFDKVVNNKTFTPLLTQNHKVDGKIAFYLDGMYHEINNSWYLNSYPSKYFKSYDEFAKEMKLPNPDYLPFAPGGCYIVPKKNILKHSKEFYAKLKEYVSWHQTPSEAHIIERSLYNIWR